ncbi:P22 phage major capsid protein family protein [Janthinobacterium sp. LB2P10]|uniref:P22 phage major capsid protein family protein n=1 Tax=Janthinobacterium sp. LB2P10 TaxID=3424194 RepID=UPI003F1F0063
MPNVLNNLAADIYKAADMVGRELIGILPSATLNMNTEGAALGDTVRSHFSRVPVVQGITPSMTIPEGTDQTVDSKTMVIDTPASVQIPWTGEEMKHVNNGSGFETIYGDQIIQAIRAIANQMEATAAAVLYKNASRAFGTSGTTPFGSNFNEVAEMRQILVDNGCPIDGQVTLALSTTAGTKLRNLTGLQSASAAGGTELLRQGTLLDLQGLMIKESAGIQLVTKGTGTAYTTNAAGYAVGATVITLITGSGTSLQGDVVTFAGDANQYVVASGASAPGTITLAAPGLRQAIPASATAMTITNSYTGNIAFHKSALEVAMRPMANPAGGDAAVDSMVVQDPRSGLVFAVDAYKGFKKAMFMVSCVYGMKAWKTENIATLKG